MKLVDSFRTQIFQSKPVILFTGFGLGQYYCAKDKQVIYVLQPKQI